MVDAFQRVPVGDAAALQGAQHRGVFPASSQAHGGGGHQHGVPVWIAVPRPDAGATRVQDDDVEVSHLAEGNTTPYDATLAS